jgi:PHD/YefM family antitoxin component YafN of YafNO toxin-antitoxin module
MLGRFAPGIRRASGPVPVTADVRRKISLDTTHVITHALSMQTVTATTARSMIYKLLDDASDSHEPIQITGKRSSAVLVAEDDWRAIQESLYLVSIPGMRESIRSGLATPIAACAKKLDW